MSRSPGTRVTPVQTCAAPDCVRRYGAARAGAWYFACVFAAGFMLGAFRVTVMVPTIGATGAVALECPAILGWSWFVCGRILRHGNAPFERSGRVVMGAVAFGLTIVAELALSLTMGGGSVRGFLLQYMEAAGAIGLAAQIGFGILPLFR